MAASRKLAAVIAATEPPLPSPVPAADADRRRRRAARRRTVTPAERAPTDAARPGPAPPTRGGGTDESDGGDDDDEDAVLRMLLAGDDAGVSPQRSPRSGASGAARGARVASPPAAVVTPPTTPRGTTVGRSVFVPQVGADLAALSGGGAVVSRVPLGSALRASGVAAGDVIVAVNGHELRSRDDVERLRGGGAPGGALGGGGGATTATLISVVPARMANALAGESYDAFARGAISLSLSPSPRGSKSPPSPRMRRSPTARSERLY